MLQVKVGLFVLWDLITLPAPTMLNTDVERISDLLQIPQDGAFGDTHIAVVVIIGHHAPDFFDQFVQADIGLVSNLSDHFQITA